MRTYVLNYFEAKITINQENLHNGTSTLTQPTGGSSFQTVVVVDRVSLQHHALVIRLHSVYYIVTYSLLNRQTLTLQL